MRAHLPDSTLNPVAHLTGPARRHRAVLLQRERQPASRTFADGLFGDVLPNISTGGINPA
jgi:hypothetical protein